jgi:hypothetical protein
VREVQPSAEKEPKGDAATCRNGERLVLLTEEAKKSETEAE